MIQSYREQKESKTLNILTGFQIIDGVRQIFVLEGLRDEAIKRLTENLPLDQQYNGIIRLRLLHLNITFSYVRSRLFSLGSANENV
jgi:hypothetical protein